MQKTYINIYIYIKFYTQITGYIYRLDKCEVKNGKRKVR